MYLLIYPKARESLYFALFEQGHSFAREYTASNREALRMVEVFLEEHNVLKNEIQGVAFIQGTGSFAGTRVSATISNTWSYAAGIPALGFQIEDLENYEKMIQEFQKFSGQHFVRPTYSAEPNIGGKK